MDNLGAKKTIFIHVNSLTGGGAERVASLWASGLRRRGHNVTIVIRNDGRKITYLPDEGVSVERIGPRHGSRREKLKGRLRDARRLMKARHPDVIIGVLSEATFEAWVASRGLGIPVVNTEHNAFEQPHSAPMTRSRRFKKRWLNRLYDHVTVLTSADYAIAGKFLKHLTLMPNPLAFEPLDDLSVMDDKQKFVLASGRLDDWHYKGFDLLIKAWGMTPHEGWKLKIMGTGSLRNRMRMMDLAEECGVKDSIVLAGYTDDPLSDYRDASVFVLSSRYEGFGMVLIEAMSQGCACIASDYKGRQREIFGDTADTGLIVDVESSKAISEGLSKVIDDADMRRRMQLNAIKRSAHFALSHVTDRWEEIFATLPSPRHNKSRH